MLLSYTWTVKERGITEKIKCIEEQYPSFSYQVCSIFLLRINLSILGTSIQEEGVINFVSLNIMS